MPSSHEANAVSLSLGDWTTVAAYLAAMAIVTIWSKRRQRSQTEDYFLAGRSQNWFIIAVTLFTAFFSPISFVAIPGEAYSYGLLYSVALFMLPLPIPLATWLFLRFFFVCPTNTAYEYLERRFNSSMRTAGAMIFCLSKLLYCGLGFYAAGQLFESLVGWQPGTAIMLIGLFTVACTTYGGIKSVIATGLMKAIVLLVSITAILFKLLAAAQMNFGTIYHFAADHGHGYNAVLTPEFYAVNLHTRYNFWLLAYMVFIGQLASLSCDQLSVQRLLTSKGYAGAKRAVLFNSMQLIPIVMLFWAVGIGLFYFYRALHPERLPPGITSDHLIGYFIATELPHPLPGFIVAALLATLINTASSVVNSIASVVYSDGLIRFGSATWLHQHQMLICKSLSIAAGLLAIAFAEFLVWAGEGVKSSVLEISGIWGGVTAVLLAAFLIGVVVPRVSGRAMLVGCVIATVITLSLPPLFYYPVPESRRISFVWFGVPGLLVALLLPLSLSLIWPNRKNLKGLTLWTMSRQDPDLINPPTAAAAIAAIE